MIVDSLTERARRVETVTRRATPLPLMVRFAVFCCGLGALLIACPAVLLTSRFSGVLLLVAVLPAVWPRGITPTVVPIAAVGGWLVATTGFGERAALARILGLAALLYLGHVLATLAASLPYDALVRFEVVARRLARALGVVLGASVLIVLVLSLVGQVVLGAFAYAAVAGLVAAVGIAAMLARLSR